MTNKNKQMSKWIATKFETNTNIGIIERSGYEYLGLGLHIDEKFIKPKSWNLTHLATGLKIGKIKGKKRAFFPVATKLAVAKDWTFVNQKDYKNTFPDAHKIALALANLNPNFFIARNSDNILPDTSNLKNCAIQIAKNREGTNNA